MTTTPLSLTSDDLALYFGTPVDDDRADFLIDMVMSDAATIVSPLPDAAKSTILGVVARIYSNPANLGQEVVGPLQFSAPRAGNLLTNAERQALRRAAGGGGAFMVDPLGITGTDDAADYPLARFPQA